MGKKWSGKPGKPGIIEQNKSGHPVLAESSLINQV